MLPQVEREARSVMDACRPVRQHLSVSFDLDVLAVDRDADDDQVRAMVLRCRSSPHPEGELDDRIVSFYEALRARYPDHPPVDEVMPWALAPLDVGIDHVSMYLRHGPQGDAVIQLVLDLAAGNGLTIYDPQSDTVTRPGPAD
jgi:hypothetical protein